MALLSIDDGRELWGYIRTASAMSTGAMTQLLAGDGVHVDARFWASDVDMLLHLIWFLCAPNQRAGG